MNNDPQLDLGPVIKHFKPDSRLVVLTGAGASVESGVPHFRGENGLWETYDPAEFATAEALRLRPEKVWEMHDALRQLLDKCKPNPGHYAVAQLEQIFPRVTVITQNVDNYHQDAEVKTYWNCMVTPGVYDALPRTGHGWTGQYRIQRYHRYAIAGRR